MAYDDAIDLEAYFRRVGHVASSAPTLKTLQALALAQPSTIPFTNLDILLGAAVDLDAAAVERKLVHARRGGYCFEQNGLLARVLRQLGYDVTPLGARVLLRAAPGEVPPRTHMILRVDLDGLAWIVDVGFGSLSPTAALRLEPDVEQATPHEPRRLRREGERWLHQAFVEGRWIDAYAFTLDELYPVDQELANWWTSTSPKSTFRNRFAVARAAAGATRLTIENATFRERVDGVVVETREIASGDELRHLLESRFELRCPAVPPWPLPRTG